MLLHAARSRFLLGLAAVAAATASCTPAPDGPCQTDSDCKAARICQDKVCVDPPSGAGTGSCFDLNGHTVCGQSPPSGPAPDMPPPPPMAGPLPKSASLDMTGFVVANQGKCGACAVFAIRDAMGARSIAQTGTFTDFSPADIAYLADFTDSSCGIGTFVQSVYTRNTYKATDVVSSTVWPWPYDPALPTSSLAKVPAQALLDQGIARMGGESGIAPGKPGLDDIKNAIAQGWPAAIGFPIFDSSGWDSPDGAIDMPTNPNETSTVSHAVMVYSYDDDKQVFGFVNSWGTQDFGKGGYGTLSYRFLEKYLSDGIALQNIVYKPTGGSCGNGTLDPGEQCDGAALGGATCKSQGFDAGSLACTPGLCTFDTAGCCHSTCSQSGAMQCVGSSSQTCTTGPLGCLAWGSDTSCPSGCDTATGHCKGADPCQGVVCNNPPNAQCYNPTGTCNGGACSYTPKSYGSSCSDGNACTTGDVCDGNGSCAGSPLSCTTPPSSQCYQTTGTCSGGACSYTPSPAGTPCDDGNPSTLNDQCNGAGVCGGCTPSVSSVSPQVATLDQPTTFTINGSCMPSSIAPFIANCAGLSVTSTGTTQATFQCTPSYSTGAQSGLVKDKSGGTVLYSFSLDVLPCTPAVNSVTPTSANLGQLTTFTIHGSCLPTTIAPFIANCAGLSVTSTGTTQATFQCTPSYSTGFQSGLVKDKSGGTVLYNFSLDVL